MWTLERPWEWALPIPGRKINPFFALAEVVWMWSGKGGVEFISEYNKTIANFADDNIPYFNAAYGRRIRHAGYDERPYRELPYLITPGLDPTPVDIDQLDFAIKKIQADPETRQAAISLWDVVKDNITKSKDHPCNNMVYLWQRNGKLNATVVIRSNDLIWGTPYNMVQFVHLQALAAGKLGYGMGHFTVMCNNLHYYLDLYPPTLEVVDGWAGALQLRSVDLDDISDGIFPASTGNEMLWDLDRFDGFVRNIWDVTEKKLRMLYSYDGVPAAYNVVWIELNDSFSNSRVPPYWRAVFAVMFMHHLRKSKKKGCIPIYNDILTLLPPYMRWLINDFTSKSQEE